MDLIRKIKYLLAIVAIISLPGCTSIDPEPFEKFHASLIELDKGATSSLDVTIPLSESRYRKELVEEIMQGKDDLLQEVSILVNSTDPFYVSNPPVFLIAQRFKLGISKANMVWLDYSKLLMQLSSDDLVDKSEFEQMATDLNSHAMDAIQALDVSASDTASENVAIFSKIAVDLTKEFIDSKTKEKLTEIITENQNNIEKYVELMQAAIITIAQSSTQEHSEKQADTQSVFISLVVDNSDGKKDAKIQKSLNDLIEVKRTHSSQISSLQSLYSAYGRVPEAHKALAKRLAKADAPITAISALLEKGLQMHTSYEAKAKINKAELVQAKADVAIGQAALAEFKYQQAQLNVSQALFDYTLAQNLLNADPDNVINKKDVEAKKRIASELKLEAENLEKSVAALRAAATAIQENASQVKNSITAN